MCNDDVMVVVMIIVVMITNIYLVLTIYVPLYKAFYINILITALGKVDRISPFHRNVQRKMYREVNSFVQEIGIAEIETSHLAASLFLTSFLHVNC